jgi:hypothetical protein
MSSVVNRITRGSAGRRLEEIILRQAAGLDLGSLQREEGPAGVMMIPIPAAGRLHACAALPKLRLCLALTLSR